MYKRQSKKKKTPKKDEDAKEGVEAKEPKRDEDAEEGGESKEPKQGRKRKSKYHRQGTKRSREEVEEAADDAEEPPRKSKKQRHQRNDDAREKKRKSREEELEKEPGQQRKRTELGPNASLALAKSNALTKRESGLEEKAPPKKNRAEWAAFMRAMTGLSLIHI